MAVKYAVQIPDGRFFNKVSGLAARSIKSGEAALFDTVEDAARHLAADEAASAAEGSCRYMGARIVRIEETPATGDRPDPDTHA